MIEREVIGGCTRKTTTTFSKTNMSNNKYFLKEDLYSRVTCPYCKLKGTLLYRFSSGGVHVEHETAWVKIWNKDTKAWIRCEASISYCIQGEQRGLAWQPDRAWRYCEAPRS